MRRVVIEVCAALVVSVGLISGCGAEEAEPVANRDLLMEYAESTEVENDRFPSSSGTSPEDRLAQMAAFGGPEAVMSALVSAFPCASVEDGQPGSWGLDEEQEAACDFSHRARGAARGAAYDPVYARSILVKHGGGSLEVITVYVVERSEGAAVLVDRNGETYTGLRDFRTSNDLLDPGDLMLVPRDITDVSGGGEVVTVAGRPGYGPRWGLVGGIGAVVVLGVGLIVVPPIVRRRRIAQAMRDAGLSTKAS